MTIDPLTTFAQLADPAYITMEVTTSSAPAAPADGYVIVTANGVPFALAEAGQVRRLTCPPADPEAGLPPLVVVDGARTVPDLLDGRSLTLLDLPVTAIAVSRENSLLRSVGEGGTEAIVGVVPATVIDQYIVDQGAGLQSVVKGPGWWGSPPDKLGGPPQTGLATVRCRRCGTINRNILVYNRDDPQQCENDTDEHPLESG
ncbi:hypothetical protein AB0J57_34145 [Streptomyces sp. NPDC049837]|uniref:hypothetical protein n=1 Tax=Streptomyces sp. NPDC049837 TaxID=3155277 RepID=UPI00343509C7